MNTESNAKTNNSNIRWGITIVGSGAVILLGIIMALFPEQGAEVSSIMFSALTNNFGAVYLWFGLFALGACLFLAFSKYGKLQLGNGKPEFSKGKIFYMVVCSSFGSATLYWLFMECVFYFNSKIPGVEPLTDEAGETALAMSFFNWGPSVWAMFAIGGAIVGYVVYIRKNTSTRFSNVVDGCFEGKVPAWLKKAIDICFVVITLGGISVTLGVSMPMIAAVISKMFNIKNIFALEIGIILVIAVIFIVSSFVGIDKGMKRISTWNIYGFLTLLVIVFLVEDKIFFVNYTTDAIGVWLDKYLYWSFATDPIGKNGFPQNWVIFYFTCWVTYAPSVGVFLARISKGHRLKDIIILTVFGGTVGCILMFGIVTSYTMSLQLNGVLDLVAMSQTMSNNEIIIQILSTLPLSKIVMLLFCAVGILFMATSLDSASFSLASITTKKLNATGNPKTSFKLYWCVILVIFPLALMAANAPLDAIKNVGFVLSLPMTIVMFFAVYGTLKQIRRKFGKMTAEEINDYVSATDETLDDD